MALAALRELRLQFDRLLVGTDGVDGPDARERLRQLLTDSRVLLGLLASAGAVAGLSSGRGSRQRVGRRWLRRAAGW
ncbi:hypothetical protein F7R91_40560 [Streptomyces luteolifulvus]|uniref:Uncharacterized protein n=1 Tax=Streptomyces luteolifulvus TaxID=2615112 RepID=A0A6H9UNG4_9ACTN|nr:hypothetical protein F7R91_40560 [Streptomyces luteolifulvus]